ncbi:MAG: peptidyl-prolyl cis-trans isomerase [Bacteroidaceae bacterium]|nr:peptidyl-prolyl cis-trans isomerase [Bacteroidaceae bacterium]
MPVVKLWLLAWLVGIGLVACKHSKDHQGQTPLVEVDGNFLYVEDLRKVLPANVSKDDSLLFAEHYIRNWIEDVLLLVNAERNVQEDENIHQLVENYRRALVLHRYQQKLMEQRLAFEISESEIDSFYRENTSQFLLEQPMVKGLYIKVPLNAKGMNNVRQWYKKKDQEVIEKMEKYSLQHAVDYLYFYNHWLYLDEIFDRIPVKVDDAAEYVRRNMDVEVRDTAFCYFMHIDTLLLAGQPMPIDYAKNEIREILMNMRQVDFMKQVKGKLYEEAQNEQRIIYHY